ncbi:restriction endonuclease subunit S [Lactococcus lactis]|uniref:restriction endonuclease subunit S n=1 Tax=Lactococcus lactis TaxID=1358 RepID=UPI0025A1151C|nr:restriction endonuclease subunit S [Lactococcus lactis]MDM7511171.1 restriction endonuclease subunit S [Lactococcus lactis]
MAKINDSVKKKVPELRFKGFTDDWEERKLGELSNIVGGGTPSTSNPEYWDGDIDWYAPAEIGEQSYVSKSKKTITELGLKKSSARILPVGTVLFTSRAGIGNTAILAKEATTNQGFQSIVPVQNKLDSYFIFSRTNELKRYGEVTGAGSTFVEVSGKQMSKMSIMVPELSEQQKIGSFFKQLDDTIALHQRKLNLLKEQKKGYLQKMFPKNGAKVPELRFAGFADDWEERKLGEIGSFKNGMNFGKDAMGHGSPFVNLQNIFGKNIVDDTTLELAESTEKQKVEYSLIKGDVLFIRSSVKPSGVGEAALVDSNLPDTTYSGFIIRFRPKIDIDNNFKRFVFGTKYVRNQIMARATSSANTNINQDSLSLIQVGLPNLKEQEKIGSFFKHLDDTIALHQRKLDLLKEQKKGFLQKMFV